MSMTLCVAERVGGSPLVVMMLVVVRSYSGLTGCSFRQVGGLLAINGRGGSSSGKRQENEGKQFPSTG